MRPARSAGPMPETWSCKACGELPVTAFHASVIKDCKHLCKACIRSRNMKYINERPEVFVARRAREGAGPGSEEFSAKDVAVIMERFGHACAMTGTPGVPLTIVAVDAARPLDVDNAAPVWRCMAPSLSRMGRAQRREVLLAGAAGALLLRAQERAAAANGGNTDGRADEPSPAP